MLSTFSEAVVTDGPKPDGWTVLDLLRHHDESLTPEHCYPQPSKRTHGSRDCVVNGRRGRKWPRYQRCLPMREAVTILALSPFAFLAFGWMIRQMSR